MLSPALSTSSSPALHHRVKGGCCSSPGSAHSHSHSAMVKSSEWSKQSSTSSAAAASEGSRRTKQTPGRLSLVLSLLLASLFLLVPLLSPLGGSLLLVLGSLLEDLYPLEKYLGEGVARLSDLNHVLPGVHSLSLAHSAQVIVIQLQRLVPDASDGHHVAPVAGDPVVDSLDLLLPSVAGLSGHGGLLVPLEAEAELVQRPRHLSKGDDPH